MKFMKVVNKIFFVIKLLIVFFYFGGSYALAETVESTGVGTATYEGVYTKKKVLAAIETAKSNACVNAFSKHIKGMEESKRMIFESIQDQIYNNLSEYMTCATEVDVPDLSKKKSDEVKKIKANKKVSVAMRADIDVTRINMEINKSSKVFDSSTGEKSSLAMIFFSRTIVGQREFEEKVTDVEQVTSSIEVDEEETDTGISSESTGTTATTTGGSTLKKANVTQYKVDDNDSIKLEAGMKEIFTKARFEPRSGKRLVRKKWRTFRDEIVESLESGGAIPEEVRWDIEDILMDKNISNPATGLINVNVALAIAEIIRLGDSDPVSLGTISGVQTKGQGSDSEIAKNNGINKTAQKTAKKLVALINSKGIN
jgi:hypothetical protein